MFGAVLALIHGTDYGHCTSSVPCSNAVVVVVVIIVSI